MKKLEAVGSILTGVVMIAVAIGVPTFTIYSGAGVGPYFEWWAILHVSFLGTLGGMIAEGGLEALRASPPVPEPVAAPKRPRRKRGQRAPAQEPVALYRKRDFRQLSPTVASAR